MYKCKLVDFIKILLILCPFLGSFFFLNKHYIAEVLVSTDTASL